jgi:WXG100 family type VII secretion target
MATSYQTDMSTMQVASQHVEEVSASIQAQLSQLENQIMPVASQWVGSGGSAFQALHERWQQDAAKINQVLAQIAQGIRLNASQYSQAEDAASSSMNRTAAQL